MMDEFDIGEGAAAPSSALEPLHNALSEAVELELAVEQMEADLKAAKNTLNAMKSKRIPDLMTELMPGMEKLNWNGWEVTISDFISGSLPKEEDKREAALRWLEDNGAGGLIKTEIDIQFGRGEKEAAEALFKSLSDSNLSPTMQTGVHAQTLAAFARERIKNGEDIDTDMLGLYTGRVAKFKQVKK